MKLQLFWCGCTKLGRLPLTGFLRIGRQKKARSLSGRRGQTLYSAQVKEVRELSGRLCFVIFFAAS